MKLNELKKIIKEVINEGIHYDDVEYSKQEAVIINLLNLVKNEDTDDTDWDRAYEMLEEIVNQLRRDANVLIKLLSNEDSDDVDFDNAYNDLGYISKLFSVLIDNGYDAADELEGLMGSIHLALTGGSGVEKMAISENKQKTMKKQEFINLIKECINEVMLEGRIQDPDKEEMMQYLRSQFGNDINDDAEVAMYYFASDFHGGQSSNLYSVLSTSEYKPGASGDVESEGELVKMMYDSLVDEFGGGSESADDSGEMSLDKIADLRGDHDSPPEPMDSEDDFNERVNFSLNELKNLIGECISEVYSEQGILKEKAPPGMEDFIKASKQSFIDQYGEEQGMKNLYATAWKKFYEKNSKKEEGNCGCSCDDSKNECGTMQETKWQQAALHPSRKGMFDNKTMADLKKMLVAIKNQTDNYKSKGEKVPAKLRSKIGQLLYAIRAKKHHGSLKKGSDI
jgi:hypothetical protein